LRLNDHEKRAAIRLLASFVLALIGIFSVSAAEGSQLTTAQVDKAVHELDALAAKQIQDNTIPGLAIAVVFQDKVVYAKGFGHADKRPPSLPPYKLKRVFPASLLNSRVVVP
jgi:CubicO group peptidase (beta-lactamase class C family)